MKIILMRHGEAERETLQDNKRQLTEFGHQQASETARHILGKYRPDVFVVSPYDRAQQTLATYTDLLPDIPIIVNDKITPSDDAIIALDSLAESLTEGELADMDAECVLVVCHMSVVAKMASLLTGGHPDAFALAEARVIDAEYIAADLGDEVERFVPVQP